jgi:Peptidase M50B-like
MMVAHESGHVVGAWLTGGKVKKIVAHPLTFSRTDLSDNPRPLLVAWAGPVGGSLFPLTALGLAYLCRMPGLHVLRFFAGFCLIANGAYIGVGSFLNAGDARDLLRHGAATWQLWAFGLATAPLGVYLWHNQGPYFGLGRAEGKVQPSAAYAVLILLLALIALELLFGGE